MQINKYLMGVISRNDLSPEWTKKLLDKILGTPFSKEKWITKGME
jgi:hypothetical protein